ncbi:MAG: proton-conducting transporter membrane subunit [Pirellulaceae bacterium]
MDASLLPLLLGVATLLPLASFFFILCAGPQLGRFAAFLATGAILLASVLSFTCLVLWLGPLGHFPADHHGAHAEHGDGEHHGDGGDSDHASGEHAPAEHAGAEHAGAEQGGAEQGGAEQRGAEPGSAEAEKEGEQETPAPKGIREEPNPDEEKPADKDGDSALNADSDDAAAVVRGQSPDTAAEGETSESPADGHDDSEQHAKPEYAGDYYLLGQFGSLRLSIGYYIDTLTITMFCMVTLIATLIHFYAQGYMHDELHDITDHEVTLSDGSHLHRPGRYYRFFQYLSLFCFSMLGLVLAGNIAMVFVFWELVGICSYFLIGFYVERKSASNAANKAFIVNRVGDFGMIIGLMALWTALGTFNFGDISTTDADGHKHTQAGMFSIVRPAHHDNQLILPKGFLRMGGHQEISALVEKKVLEGASQEEIDAAIEHQLDEWYTLEIAKQAKRSELTDVRVELAEAQDEANLAGTAENRAKVADNRAKITAIHAELAELQEKNPSSTAAYWLLVVAGVGIFCGCVGKSAQFPLHVWLPDAMEGPTPVSALVHSATMVAAGVYLVGRFYPVFAPEVLLVIAVAGTITLFMAATIAIVATDIKRVLAYSTISQLGYMMLALGLGGWVAGIMHLITHAFFKSLLFMCSGSVIHAVHTNEMPQMGGLLKKMPYTGVTMLIGCLAIIGAGIPAAGIGLSGYYSKDFILEQSFLYMLTNGRWTGVFFAAAAGGATITAFYMFRLWFMTFLGKPRDHHRYEHAHESPKVMYVPLIVLAVFAVSVAWPFLPLNLSNMLHQARPTGTEAFEGVLTSFMWPDESIAHLDENFAKIVVPVGLLAFGSAAFGVTLAAVFYWFRVLDAAEARKSFAPIHRFLLNKWWFDELYEWLFIKPAHLAANLISSFDRGCIDRLIDNIARGTTWLANFWAWFADQLFVDGCVNTFASWMYGIGVALREVQTGRIRQYVMFIIVGAIALFLLISFFLNPTLAG